MTRTEFGRIFKPITDVWPQSFTKDKIIIYFDLFEKESPSLLDRVVKKLLREKNFAPVPADFQETIKMFKKADSEVSFDHFDTVLSKEEVSENIQFLREVLDGKHSKKDIDTYCEIVDSALRSKGVKPKPWRDE